MGGTAQVAGGVPAMCDGVTQGQAGMELSLFSRDVIAMAAGDRALAQRLRRRPSISASATRSCRASSSPRATFGHLPAVFLPAGPMTSGIPNDEKAKVRQQFATGEVGRDALMEAEMASYHGPGTCTFYGTANTNQMLMEFMGLHLPGASFVNPNTPLRDALTIEGAAAGARDLARSATSTRRSATSLDERAFVNGIVGLNATGGSTNLLDPPDRDGPRRRRPPRLGGLRRALRRDAADGARLPERPRRREPLPRRRAASAS